ncbi:colipase-like protein 2 [Mirounga angustirostris]|uniref:colipase-like protein 2 n=1 Tax=Mirounga angustirostris TaxID=9716 RepID=UPI00313B9677
MATAFVLLVGVLLPCWGEFLPFKKKFMKVGGGGGVPREGSTNPPSSPAPLGRVQGGGHLVVTISWLLFLDPWGLGDTTHPHSPSHTARELVTRELSPQVNGAECSHHSECSSDCCLIDLDRAGAFCAPKARIAMLCLFQTKGAINIICPCQSGLSCISKDPGCSRRCHLI